MEAPLSDLPQETIEHILEKLPAKALFRFKSVCKSWLRYIHKMHRRVLKTCDTARPFGLGCVQFLVNYLCNASLRLSGFVIVDKSLPRELRSVFGGEFLLHGPCHGVYLVFDGLGNAALWNHASGDFKIVPNERQESHLFVVYGFGIEEDGVCVDDFLVLKFHYKKRLYEERVPKLYRSSTGAWKVVTTPPEKFQCDWISNPSVYQNRMFYWLAARNRCWFLVSFDTRTETFGEVDVPGNLPEGEALLSRYASNGSEFLSFTVSTEDKRDVWVMKESSDGRHWVKEVSIKNDSIWSRGRKAVNVRDSKADTWFETLEYEESFLPLNLKGTLSSANVSVW